MLGVFVLALFVLSTNAVPAYRRFVQDSNVGYDTGPNFIITENRNPIEADFANDQVGQATANVVQAGSQGSSQSQGQFLEDTRTEEAEDFLTWKLQKSMEDLAVQWAEDSLSKDNEASNRQGQYEHTQGAGAGQQVGQIHIQEQNQADASIVKTKQYSPRIEHSPVQTFSSGSQASSSSQYGSGNNLAAREAYLLAEQRAKETAARKRAAQIAAEQAAARKRAEQIKADQLAARQRAEKEAAQQAAARQRAAQIAAEKAAARQRAAQIAEQQAAERQLAAQIVAEELAEQVAARQRAEEEAAERQRLAQIAAEQAAGRQSIAQIEAEQLAVQQAVAAQAAARQRAEQQVQQQAAAAEAAAQAAARQRAEQQAQQQAAAAQAAARQREEQQAQQRAAAAQAAARQRAEQQAQQQAAVTDAAAQAAATQRAEQQAAVVQAAARQRAEQQAQQQVAAVQAAARLREEQQAQQQAQQQAAAAAARHRSEQRAQQQAAAAQTAARQRAEQQAQQQAQQQAAAAQASQAAAKAQYDTKQREFSRQAQATSTATRSQSGPGIVELVILGQRSSSVSQSSTAAANAAANNYQARPQFYQPTSSAASNSQSNSGCSGIYQPRFDRAGPVYQLSSSDVSQTLSSAGGRPKIVVFESSTGSNEAPIIEIVSYGQFGTVVEVIDPKGKQNIGKNCGQENKIAENILYQGIDVIEEFEKSNNGF